MKQSGYKKKIIEACKQAGTYDDSFLGVIDSLALVLQRRDEANEFYKSTGCQAIIEYTNKGGATNYVKNPALILWDDLNKTALAYWKELGLTASTLKRINENALNTKKRSVLADVLKDLNEGL